MNVRAVLGLILIPVFLGCAAERPAMLAGESAPPATEAEQRTTSLQAALVDLDRRLAARPADHEARLLKALLWFEAGEFEAALAELSPLIHDVPEFQLARLIRADVLAARAEADASAEAPVASGSDVGLRHEARVRLDAYRHSRAAHLLPRTLLQLGASTPRALLVDKHRHRLYVFENSGPDAPPRMVRDMYVSLGRQPGNKTRRGDLRTPEGVYFITRHIPGAALPPKYGRGAFPLDYPNPIDRDLGKTGDGIWLHGTAPEYYSRPPLDSEGCVVLANPDLDELSELLTPGTPVVIGEGLSWVEQSEWAADRASARAAATFFLGKGERTGAANELSLFAYPESAGENRLVLAGAGADGRPVRHYLRRDAGTWQAVSVENGGRD